MKKITPRNLSDAITIFVNLYMRDIMDYGDAYDAKLWMNLDYDGKRIREEIVDEFDSHAIKMIVNNQLNKKMENLKSEKRELERENNLLKEYLKKFNALDNYYKFASEHRNIFNNGDQNK